jgi:hypothetical protein
MPCEPKFNGYLKSSAVAWSGGPNALMPVLALLVKATKRLARGGFSFVVID